MPWPAAPMVTLPVTRRRRLPSTRTRCGARRVATGSEAAGDGPAAAAVRVTETVDFTDTASEKAAASTTVTGSGCLALAAQSDSELPDSESELV